MRQTASWRRGGWLGVMVALAAALAGVARGQSNCPTSSTWVTNDIVDGIACTSTTIFISGAYKTGPVTTTTGWVDRSGVAALDRKNGSATSWDPRPNHYIDAMAYGEGLVYIGGSFSQIGGKYRSNLAALDPVTGLATDWSPQGNTRIYEIAVFNGVVYIGGIFNTMGGKPRANIAAIDAATGLLLDWNPGADGNVNKIEVIGSTVYVQGRFNNIGGKPRKNIAALDLATGQALDWNPIVDWYIWDFVYHDGAVYLGGDFSKLNGQARKNLAAVDAVTGYLLDWDPGTNGSVLCLAYSDSKIYVGGSFTQIGGQARNRLAAVDVDSGRAMAWNPNLDNTVTELATYEGTVYAGGCFTTVSGKSRPFFAQFDPVPPLSPPCYPEIKNIRANSITLTWLDNATSETGFKVWGDEGARSPGTLRATTAANATEWTWTGLTPNTLYSFQAAATDGIQDTSRTAVVSCHTSCLAPVAGQNVACDRTTGTTQACPDVTFTNPTGFGPGTDGGNVYRVNQFRYAWDNAPTHSFNGSESVWNQGGLTFQPALQGNYYLHLQSFNEAGIAGGSLNYGPINIMPYLGMPLNPGANGIGVDRITWTWTDNSSGETGFKVFADPVSPVTLQFETQADATSWTMTGLTPNAQYAFQAAATDGTTDSARSPAYARYTLAGAPALGANVICDQTSGMALAWDAKVTFTNPAGFGLGTHGGSVYRVSGFRHAWTTSATHSFTGGEPVWKAGPLVYNRGAEGAWWLHLQSLNAEGAAGGTLDYGPFNFETPPVLGAKPSADPWVTNGPVYAIACTSTTVYIGGSFTAIGLATTSTGWLSRSRVAALDAATGEAKAWNPEASGTVRSLAVLGSTVYIGGEGVAKAVDANTGQVQAWWPNPSFSYTCKYTHQDRSELPWTGYEYTYSSSDTPSVSALNAANGLVLAAGKFSAIGGKPLFYNAAADPVTGQAGNLNINLGNASKTITSIRTYWDSSDTESFHYKDFYDVETHGCEIYLAGGDIEFYKINSSNWYFNPPQHYSSMETSLNGGILKKLAWDNQTASWNPNPDGHVRGLAGAGELIYAGGDFGQIAGQSRGHIAAVDERGVATSWNPNANYSVYAIEPWGGVVFAGGAFTTIGGQARNRIAALSATDGTAAAWNPDANGAVRVMANAGESLWVGGEFTTVGGEARPYLARFDVLSSPTISITGQPAPLTVDEGTTASFEVVAAGSDLSYRWLKEGVELTNGGRISGADTTTLVIAAAETGDAGAYACRVSNGAGEVISEGARLTVRMNNAGGVKEWRGYW